MKTRLLTKAIVIMAPFSFCLCSKEQPQAAVGQDTIGVTINDENNKIAIAQGTSKLTLKWQSDDCIRVCSGENSAVYNIQAGYSAHYARFTGNHVEGAKYTVFTPGTYESVDAINARSYEQQEQTGNGSTSHLEFNAIASNLDDMHEVDFVRSADNVKLNGAIKFVIKLPQEITTVESLVLEAPSAIFYKTNGGSEKTAKLVLKLTDVDVSSGILTAYMMTSWQSMNLASGTKLNVKLIVPGASESCCHMHTITLNNNYSVLGGETFVFDMSSKEIQHKLHGNGTSSSPYELYDVLDMSLISESCTSGTMTYFKLMQDIDMSGIVWEAINAADPYDKKIDFNGNHHTISNMTSLELSYSSLIGVLDGSCYDLNMTNAYVKGGYAVGILAGYVGTETITGAVVRNCHLQGKVLSEGGDKGGLGGLCGRVGTNATITECTVDAEVQAPNNGKPYYVGGIFGFDSGSGVVISNCKSTGSVYGTVYVGGIGGGLIKSKSKIFNCISTSSVSARRAAGGIFGSMNMDAESQSKSNNTNSMTKCLAWNSSITGRNTGDDSYSSGSLIGYTSRYQTLADCYRRSDLNFVVGPTTISQHITPCDQPNASSSSILSTGVVYSTSSPKRLIVPYHGKAYSGTASAAAKSLGWDETIWDLSGDIPSIKHDR